MSDEIAVIDEELIQQALSDSADSSTTGGGGALNLAVAVGEASTLRLSFRPVRMGHRQYLHESVPQAGRTRRDVRITVSITGF